VRPTKAPGPVDRLPPFNVLLHNDDEHDMEFVVRSLVRCASLQPHRAVQAMLEAHEKGVALVATCHRELAELIQERLQSDGLTATIEPAP
jgi:ATP-dependent Clp protease adaptor protein ClpS